MKRVQLCNLQEVLLPDPSIYVPYVCGALRAYAEQVPEVRAAWAFAEPVWRMQAIERMLDEVEAPDVFGFSAYVWNHRNSHLLARAVKERYPSCVVVAGGPHVPNVPSSYLEEHPHVDLCVHGEGEMPLAALLRELAGGAPDLENVPGISYRRDGAQRFTRPGDRLKSLDGPSPYLSGVFDRWLEHARSLEGRVNVMACLETNRGCPYSCSFCDWGMSTMSKLRTYPEERVRAEFEWVAQNQVGTVILNDANFGILPRDIHIMEFVAELKKRTGFPQNFFPLGFAKNNKDRAFEINRMIIDNGLDPFGMNVNFSLQATNQETLTAIARQNIPLENYRIMADRYAQSGYRLSPDLILPLPGETLESFKTGYADLASWEHVSRIRVYPCTILPNAPMADPAYREKWGIRTRVMPLGPQQGLRAREPGVVEEVVETVAATSTMTEDEHAQAKVYVHLVNALELYRLTRPLRQHAGRAVGMTPHAFYDRLAAWSPAHDGVLAGALTQIRALVMEHKYTDEMAWAGESPTFDGRLMKHHKALTYDALKRAERFVDELREFMADDVGVARDDVLEELLRYTRESWILPGFDPLRSASYRFRYERDWPAWLEGRSSELTETPVEVVYQPYRTWRDYGYRRSEDGWRAHALAEAMVDTCCVHNREGREITVLSATPSR